MDAVQIIEAIRQEIISILPRVGFVMRETTVTPITADKIRQMGSERRYDLSRPLCLYAIEVVIGSMEGGGWLNLSEFAESYNPDDCQQHAQWCAEVEKYIDSVFHDFVAHANRQRAITSKRTR